MIGSALRFARCAVLLLLSASLTCAAGAKQTSPSVAVLHSGSSYQRIAKLYKQAGYTVSVVSEGELAKLQFPSVSMLVIPPNAVFPPSARRQLGRYLTQGGNLADLSPDALSYSRQPVDAKPIVDFAGSSGYALTKPDGAVITRVAIPGTKEKGIRFDSRMIADGNLAVTVPLERSRASTRDMVCFRAKGDYNIDVLRLAIEDSTGATYVAFAELGRDWRSYAVPMTDFIKVIDKADPAALNPARVRTLTLGLSSTVVWKAAKGSIEIGPVSLARSDRFAGVMSSDVCRWRPKFSRSKAPYPEWLVDPFCEATKLARNVKITAASGQSRAVGSFGRAGQAWELQSAPIFRGEIKAEVLDELKRIEMRRIPLLVARASDGGSKIVAEVRTLTGGPQKGASMILFGIDGADFSSGSELGKALINASNYVTRTPRIVRVRPLTTPAKQEPTQLRCVVTIANPLSDSVRGELSVSLARDAMKASKAVVLAPRGLTEVELDLGVVAESFPMSRFDWSAFLTTPGTRDVLSDTVDVQRTLIRSARYMMNCQKAYRDGRYSEHFFTDIYAARTLHALGVSLGNREMIDSALRFCDMIVAKQRPDGGLPLGYADNSGVIYIADDGTIVLGLLQIASWLDDSDRVSRYLDASRKYFAFRESLYISSEKSVRLQKEYGKDAKGTQAGLYGLGILKSDYIKGDHKPWPALKAEERGVPFVMTISMGAPAALYLMDPNEGYASVVRRDADEFVGKNYTISKDSHFGVECLFWMRRVLTDAPTRSALDSKISRFMPFLLGKQDDLFDFQARGSLRLLSLAYYRSLISDGPGTRAPMLKSIWELCSESSSYSLNSVSQHFPVDSYGPSEGGFRHTAYSTIALMETLKPGSTLLGPKRRD